jgi:hypothetical protein
MKIQTKKRIQEKIENQLSPRLGAIGCILLLCALCSLTYGLMVHPIPKTVILSEENQLVLEGISSNLFEVEDDPSTLLPENIFNFYLVALLFGSMGSFCLYMASVKKKSLKNIK